MKKPKAKKGTLNKYVEPKRETQFKQRKEDLKA